MQDRLLAFEIGLTILVGIVVFVAVRWTRGQGRHVGIALELASRTFLLGTALGAIALSTMVMVFLIGLAPVHSVLLSSLIIFILTFGVRKSLSKSDRRQ